MADYKTLEVEQLLRWAQDASSIIRLRTNRDILPGGYMASSAPAMVAWEECQLQGDDGYIVLRNVNYGGNPLEHTSMLQSARVPLDGIEAVEFLLVPLDPSGTTQHANIRFIFNKQRRPQLLGLAGCGAGDMASFDDLVLSWEAWRPPQLKFELKEALKEPVYGLTQRAFAGSQVYLEDMMRGREWYAWRMRLPGDKAGMRELFKVALALGDSMARDTIRRLLQQDEQTWLSHAPAGGIESEQDAEAWQQILSRLDTAVPASVASHSLPEQEQSYQPIVRSCCTMARYAILLAVWRLMEQGYRDGVNLDKLPKAELGQVEGWMPLVASADLGRVFKTAPTALRFLARNPQVIPGKIPQQLDDAGLVVHKNGKPWKIHYGLKAIHPYGIDGIKAVE